MLEEHRLPFWQGIRNLLLALLRLLPSPELWASVALLVVLGRAVIRYQSGLVPLTVVVDGEPRHVRTQRDTVDQVLQDAGIAYADWDRISPDPGDPVSPRMEIVIDRAHSVALTADGTNRTLYTHTNEVAEILDEVGLSLSTGDELYVNGQFVDLDQAGLSPVAVASKVLPVLASTAAGGSVIPRDTRVTHIEVRRAKQIRVSEGRVEQMLYTTGRTLGQALQEAGIVLYLGDRVVPDLNAPLHTGMQVRIERGVPVSVVADGRTVRTRTHRGTVGDVLAEMGVSLVGQDFCVPEPEEPVRPGLEIKVSRVVEQQVVEQQEIPFETQWLADNTLEIDHRRVDASGANGLHRRRYRVVLQDGIEVERVLEDEWTALEPQPRKIAYGTKIVLRTVETPDGPVEYWRRVHMFLSSYTEATCGKTPDDFWYGLTRLGWKMRRGIVAVDPTVFPLLTEVYVPGYGHGIAADTGGLIIGRHIDLGYDVDNYEHWFRWEYVYILTPIPPAGDIRWILPDFPRGRWP